MTYKVLVVDDEKAIRDSLKIILEDEGYFADTAGDGEEALQKIKEQNFDIVISDIKMPKLDGMQLLDQVSKLSPDTFFIIMTAFASVNTAIDALRKGAFDYLIKPVEFDDLLIRIKRLISYKKLSSENKFLRQRISSEEKFDNLVGKSEPMMKVFKLIQRLLQLTAMF